MNISFERDSETTTLIAIPSGQIDGYSAVDFYKTMTSVISSDNRAILVDMSGVTGVSSAGWRALLMIKRATEKRDGKFMLCSLPEPLSPSGRNVLNTAATYHNRVDALETVNRQRSESNVVMTHRLKSKPRLESHNVTTDSPKPLRYLGMPPQIVLLLLSSLTRLGCSST